MSKTLYNSCSLQPLRKLFFYTQPPLHTHFSPINSTVLIIIRIISALYLTAYYIFDIIGSKTLLVRFIYLTNVGYFLTWLYFVIVVQSKFIKIAYGLDQYAELLFQLVFCTQVFITIAYWGILYTMSGSYKYWLFYDFNWHASPIILLSLDFIFNSYRFMPKQYILFLVLTFVYMFMINLPYSLCVSPVYGIATDWVSWMTYAFIAAGIIIAGLAFILGRIIYTKCKQPYLNINTNTNIATTSGLINPNNTDKKIQNVKNHVQMAQNKQQNDKIVQNNTLNQIQIN